MEFSPNLVPLGIAWFVVFVFSTTLHEAGHALAALRLGDPTAYMGGQVSLNPVPHIVREPFGMVIVPILSFVLMGGNWMFGWASAPYDPIWAMRHPRKSALMSLAGPVANLVLVLLAGLLIRVGLALDMFEPPQVLEFSRVVVAADGSATGGSAIVLSILFSLNLVLLLFNLIPLPPLDGSGVLQLFLSEGASRRYMVFMSQPMWGLVGLILAWRVFPTVFWPLFSLAVDLLYPGVYG